MKLWRAAGRGATSCAPGQFRTTEGALKGLGYDVMHIDCPDNEALRYGKEFGNRGQGGVYPTSFMFWDERGIWYPAPDWLRPMIRLRCGSQGGLVMPFGTWTQGLWTNLSGLGMPVLGETPSIALSTDQIQHGLTALLLWGGRADLQVPFGRLYVLPVLTATQSVVVPGYLLTPVPIPKDPALVGAEVAFQAWTMHLQSTSVRAHSNGVAFRIGG